MSCAADLLDEMPLDAPELVAALREHHQRAAVLALAVRRLEVSGEWAIGGAVSLAVWLREHAGMNLVDAKALARRGRFLDRFTAVGDAALDGRLSSGQIAALQSVCTQKVAGVFTEHQHGLVEAVATLDVVDTERVCNEWRVRAEAIADDGNPPTEPERELHMARAGDRSLLGRFTLDEAAAAELEQALRTADSWGGDDDNRSQARRQADSLFDIAAFFNKNHDKPGRPRHRPHIELSVDESTLDDRPEATDADGQVVDPCVTDTLLCDCALHRVLRDAERMPTGYGRARYTAPNLLFRQVAARDGGCRHPGCNRPVRWTDAHHIKYWRHHGETELWNLVLLCSRHHHLVHRLGLHLKLLPNGDLHVTWPDGTERVSHPRGAPPRRSRRS